MNQAAPAAQSKSKTTLRQGWLLAAAVLLPLIPILGWLDDTTELIPTQRSWNVQTAPLWGDFSIAKQDYQFMLAHRRPGDAGRDPDRSTSRGYFCAQVTVERADNAVRVMHAGSHTLPAGTVVLCPSSGQAAPSSSPER